MRFKSWPYYPDWVIIFVKDRATGDQGATAPDIIKNKAYVPMPADDHTPLSHPDDHTPLTQLDDHTPFPHPSPEEDETESINIPSMVANTVLPTRLHALVQGSEVVHRKVKTQRWWR